MMKTIFSNQFVRFLLVGGINTAFGYIMFALFIFLTGNDVATIILANIVGILFNFKTYGNIVFNSTDNHKIYKFIAVYSVLMVAQILALKGLSLSGITNRYISGAILTPPMALLSFFMLRLFVFKVEVQER
ncbi:MAG: GtrA family protein [Cyclobacteriaceae bacterium]